ncbi:MAG: hypothetical protein JXO22_02515, partial [Phycisphaerae bacterium]|nr:hypothetical protein [Phycisphaerae bacterium]
QYWLDAREDGRLQIQPAESDTVVDVTLIGEPGAAHDELLRTVLLDPYVARVNSVPAEPQLPPVYADLGVRRARVESELGDARREIEDCSAKIAILPVASDRTALAGEIETLRAAQLTAAEQIRAQRADVQRLTENPPKGTVAPEAIDETLSRDPVYQQDQTEFADSAETYRRELGVALLMLDEPIATARAALRQLGATVTEQRELEPPTTIATVLDDVQMDADDMSDALEALAGDVVAWRDSLEKMGAAGEDVLALVTLHNSAIEDVRHAVDGIAELATTVERRAVGLESAADGGTRHVVVAAVLRGDARPLAEAAEALRTKAADVTFEGNIELDAQNRRMRSLRGQLNRRRGIVEQQMQAAADKLAADAHEAALLEARAALRTLEDGREEHLLTLSEKVNSLQELDERLLERRGLEVELATWQKEAARLTTQLGKLDDEMNVVRRNATNPDRVALDDTYSRQEVVEGQHRLRNTTLVAAGTFLVTSLLCLLLIGHNPLMLVRRRVPRSE